MQAAELNFLRAQIDAEASAADALNQLKAVNVQQKQELDHTRRQLLASNQLSSELKQVFEGLKNDFESQFCYFSAREQEFCTLKLECQSYVEQIRQQDTTIKGKLPSR